MFDYFSSDVKMTKMYSADTHPDAERMLVSLIRTSSIGRRFRVVQSLTQTAVWTNIHAWQQRHPNKSEQEAAVQLVSQWYDHSLSEQVQVRLVQKEKWFLQPTDLLMVIQPIQDAFDELRIPWYVGGSIASSIYGMQQMAQDIDSQHLSLLLPLIKQRYAFDDDAFREAVCQRSTCSLIHLDTLMKVDVVLTKHDAFATALHNSVTSHVLDERFPPFRIASATEMILLKLHQYDLDLHTRMDGMRDDGQWNDVLGMLKVQGENLEMKVLENWAKTLHITEVLRQALRDAGIEQEEVA